MLRTLQKYIGSYIWAIYLTIVCCAAAAREIHIKMDNTLNTITTLQVTADRDLC